MSSENKSFSMSPAGLGWVVGAFLSGGGAANSSKNDGVSPDSPKRESKDGLAGVVAGVGVLPTVPFSEVKSGSSNKPVLPPPRRLFNLFAGRNLPSQFHVVQ